MPAKDRQARWEHRASKALRGSKVSRVRQAHRVNRASKVRQARRVNQGRRESKGNKALKASAGLRGHEALPDHRGRKENQESKDRLGMCKASEETQGRKGRRETPAHAVPPGLKVQRGQWLTLLTWSPVFKTAW